MALDLIAEFEVLIDAFEREGVEYAVCGGIALNLHGHGRATGDIDLLVRTETVSDALRVAKTVGFDIPARKMVFGLRAGTPREMQRVSKLDPETSQLLSVDLIIVGAELEEVWGSRLTLQVRDRRISLVSRDGLATMKRIAGRPKDLADLAALEGREDDDAEEA
jgi:hypothetical protein